MRSAAVLSGLALVLGFYFSFVSCDSAQPVTGLPSFNGTIPFKQWGGYVTVNQTEQKAYYYWFMESQRSPSTDPVVLWLQGGPGCAGTWAIFQEHGPYRITPHEEVVLNPYSWNRVANVIYIDAPAGVGFSYSNTTAGLNNNDNQTAIDNYNFLQGFFKLFPQFAQNDLWITGESYGGVYVPTLVNNIIDGPNQQLKSKLQGYLLGNPVTSCDALKEKGLTVQVNLYYDHALISFTSYDAWYTQGCDKHENRPECGKMFEEMENMIGPLDKDDLYTNFCTENATLEFQESVPNCYGLGQRTEKYFNRPDVLQAIHAQLAITEHQARKWYYCSTPVIGGLNYTMSFANMLPYYNKFFNQTQLKIYVYAGDADIADVPHSKTQLCLAELKRPNVKPWTRWTVAGPKIPPYITDSKEKSLITAGYIETFDKYTFATVKGAGHEVPMYQPMFAYYLFQRFIENGTLLV